LAGYEWKPIEPLSASDLARDVSDLQPLYDSWHAAKKRLKDVNPDSLKRFTDRLVRSLSVETGILERIYDLDRGTTEALVQHGFVEDLVLRSSTDIEPSLLIDILRDQEAAVQLVTDAVAHSRQVTKGFVHELHGVLTKHQQTTRAVDQFGKRVDIQLIKGKYKEHPNNPTRPDGSTHEYCPPIHVDSDMEKLLAWLGEYQNQDPILVAAWLHHRFTQIHPYQDGNGRVARALMTLVLLRADILPLVVDRDVRTSYVEALERGDRGDLGPLFELLASLEKKAILQALSIDLEAEVARDKSITSAVIESLAAKFQRRQHDKEAKLRKVNQVAVALRAHTRASIERAWRSLGQQVPADPPDVFLLDGGPDHHNEYWYKKEVVESAKSSGKWVNYDEDHYFVKATIRLSNVRLVFVVSFHHIGQELSGIMEVTAFAFLEFYEAENDRVASSEKFFQCSLEPFVITWNSDADRAEAPFDRWLDTSLAVAVKEWGDHL
jgi:prophage maintenance system killer protein